MARVPHSIFPAPTIRVNDYATDDSPRRWRGAALEVPVINAPPAPRDPAGEAVKRRREAKEGAGEQTAATPVRDPAPQEVQQGDALPDEDPGSHSRPTTAVPDQRCIGSGDTTSCTPEQGASVRCSPSPAGNAAQLAAAIALRDAMDEADDDSTKAQSRAVEDEIRFFCDTLKLFHLCPRALCRTTRRCRGQPRRCYDAHFEAGVVPVAAYQWVDALFAAGRSGESRAKLQATWPVEHAAFESWIAGLEARRA